MAKPKGGQRKRRTKTSTGTARLLRGVDASKLNARGKELLAAAIAADRPITANAIPTLGQALKKAKPPGTGPVSPWVRRAQQGNLPTKDMTNSSGPRADVYRGIGDIARVNPFMIQAGAGELAMTTKRAVNVYNAEREAMGLRPIDFPGRRANPGNVTAAGSKARKAAPKTKAKSQGAKRSTARPRPAQAAPARSRKPTRKSVNRARTY